MKYKEELIKQVREGKAQIQVEPGNEKHNDLLNYI